MLVVSQLTKRFGGLTALDKVDLNVERGTFFSLIGPNGSGKTTLFNTVSGIYKPGNGNISFNNHNITGLRPHQITYLGVGRVFQNIRVSLQLNALETVIVGRCSRAKTGVAASFFGFPSQMSERRRNLEMAEELLAQVGLTDKRLAIAGALSPGDQRRLQIARALATEPEFLLLDEPFSGMNEAEVAELVALVGRLKERGITMFLIEHDMNVVMNVSDRVAVLNYGRKIAEGTPREVQNDAAVIEAYLGRG